MILAMELCLHKATRGRIFTRTSKHLGNLDFLCIFALKIKQL